MSAPKFSPGPWKVNGFVAPDDLGNTKLEPTVTAGEYYVATAHDFGNSGATSNANAALIAAAPDLYEALDEAYALMPLGTAKRAEWMTKAGVALAKARGE